MAPHKVDVNPEILVVAREGIGLSRKDAARQLGLTELTLQYLEEGVGDVSIPRLKDMSRIYDRPLISFFAAKPSPQKDTLPDFRLAATKQRAWTPELHREFRRVSGQREIVLDIAGTTDAIEIPSIEFRVVVGEDPEEVALGVRSWLLGDNSVSNARPTIGEWISLIEVKGVLVTQVSGVKVSEMRGFSIGLHPLPIIALNGADSVTARLFSLIHELIHVLQHASALCDFRDNGLGRAVGSKTNERFCNAVAAAVLMPRHDLLQVERVAESSPETRWQLESIQKLATRYGVSAEAMLLRLVHLGRASSDSYGKLKPLLDKFARDQPGGFLQYYRGKVRNLGRLYISTVLTAYDQGSITDATMARYLDIKLKNVPKLIETLNFER